MKKAIDNLIKCNRAILDCIELANELYHSLECVYNTSNGFYFDFNETDNNFVL